MQEAPDSPFKRLKAPPLVRVLQWLFGLGMLGVVVAAIAVFMVIQHYDADLPSTDQLANYDPAVVTRLYASDGKLMAEYAKEKRFFLPLSAVPKIVQNAFIAAEDQNFFTNQGVDLKGTLRAARNNFMHAGQGRSMAGGSTITQQVVKNFLLSPEKSFERKIKEAILAYRISKTYSKEKILELYLNEIYLGQGTYGVAAAGLNYFNKSLDALTTEEVALLAAMPKAPAAFDPGKNYKRALERRNYVIGRMREDGYIDAAEEARARATPIVTRSRNAEEVANADFFAEEVRRNLASMYGSSVLYGGGLFVRTTLRPDFQTAADRALRYALMLYDQRHGYRGAITTMGADMVDWPVTLEKIRQEKSITLYDAQQLAVVQHVVPKVEIGLLNGNRGTLSAEGMSWAKPKFTIGDVILVEPMGDEKGQFKLLQIPAVNGAMVVMDPHTGKVLAMSGGYAYAGSEFNRATQARRQPGSAFKPFVYMTALESGFSPNSVLVDGPISLPQGPGLPMWTPKNYEGDYLGPITFRTALEHSRNAVTVRIASLIGIKRVGRIAKRLGIYDEVDSPNYSMVLGARETTLLKLVNAYSMVANGGRRVSPWLIERIDDRNGTAIFRRDTRSCEACMISVDGAPPPAPTLNDERERVIDPRVAYQITSILKGAVQRGTGGAAKVLGRPVAGKTGTTNDSRDTWFIGYTPDYVIGTYVGFDTPKSMGEKETGGRVAIQGFIKFIQQMGDKIPNRDFTPPPGIREIPVNKATGQPLYAGGESGGATVLEAFLTGGPIFKPMNELQEELKDKDDKPIVIKPEDLGAPEEGGSFDPNAAYDPAKDPNAAYRPPVPGAAPSNVGVPASGFTPPGAGQMAPYQRPVDPQGFDPGRGTETTGTGGLY